MYVRFLYLKLTSHFCNRLTNQRPCIIMTTTPTAATIFDLFPFEATRQQAEALYRLEDFVSTDCTADAFILRGAAGTGKTSLVKAVVDFLNQQEIGFCLTAPTGRAAKVLGYKTQVMAHTLYHTFCLIKTDGGGTPTILFPKKESMEFVPVFGKFLSLPYEKLLSLPPVTIFYQFVRQLI